MNKKCLRLFILQQFYNLRKFGLPFGIIFNNCIKNHFIESFFFKKNGTTQTKDILFISDKGIRKLSFYKRVQIIVIYYCLFENRHKLIYTVYKFFYILSCNYRICIGSYNIVNKLLFNDR